jgi:hypothetical protein
MQTSFHTSYDFTHRIFHFFQTGRKTRRASAATRAFHAPHEHHSPMMVRTALVYLLQKSAAHSIEQKIRDHTARQLSLSLKLCSDDAHMHAVLESLLPLVEANEISFAAFVNKLDHLYPDAMKGLDVHLKLRVTSLLQHSH